MQLFGHWRSLATMRVRIALRLKGLDVAETAVDILGGGQFEAGFLALNPQARVPALVVDDGPPLVQSLAILEWLEESYPAPALLPADARGRARVRALGQIIACDTHPLLVPSVRARLGAQFGAGPEAIADWARHWITAGLTAVEGHLARDAVPGAFCHGDAPGLADICLYSICVGSALFGGLPPGLPQVARVAARCAALPEFAASEPLRQPGAPAPG
jgi:maleylacetoacetate isomerase